MRRLARRDFLKRILMGGFSLLFPRQIITSEYKEFEPKKSWNLSASTINMHPSKQSVSSQQFSSLVIRSLNGPPPENIKKVIELIGGIEKIIGEDDIVMIKPNLQWWSQGAPNLAAFKALIELIMEKPGGFKGEVIILENCHRGSAPWQHGGWANIFERNADLKNIRNMNELANLLKERYGSKISIIHLVDIKAGGKRVFHPKDGPGYVYCDGSNGIPLLKCENGKKGKDYRATIMTYPIFKTSKGTIIDFKKGVWEKGSYTDQPIKFINLAALNHHSTYCGMTSAIKNYMGITDLSGGANPDINGRLIGGYYNFHAFSFNEWSPGPELGMLGRAIGTFMKTIRRADLNITTAEWTGLSSRVEPPVAHTRAVLASTDPVALDYHAAKYLLYPNSKISFHNPDLPNSPIFHLLEKCSEIVGGALNEREIDVKSYDFRSNSFQGEENLQIKAPIYWGRNLKTILKYWVLRYWKAG